MGLSLPHLLVIALLVFLLFGANRFPNMMGDLAKGIKSFKQGLKDEDEVKTDPPKILPRSTADIDQPKSADQTDHINRT